MSERINRVYLWFLVSRRMMGGKGGENICIKGLKITGKCYRFGHLVLISYGMKQQGELTANFFTSEVFLKYTFGNLRGGKPSKKEREGNGDKERAGRVRGGKGK